MRRKQDLLTPHLHAVFSQDYRILHPTKITRNQQVQLRPHPNTWGLKEKSTFIAVCLLFMYFAGPALRKSLKSLCFLTQQILTVQTWNTFTAYPCLRGNLLLSQLAPFSQLHTCWRPWSCPQSTGRRERPWCNLQQQQAAVHVNVFPQSASETCGQCAKEVLVMKRKYKEGKNNRWGTIIVIIIVIIYSRHCWCYISDKC